MEICDLPREIQIRILKWSNVKTKLAMGVAPSGLDFVVVLKGSNASLFGRVMKLMRDLLIQTNLQLDPTAGITIKEMCLSKVCLFDFNFQPKGFDLLQRPFSLCDQC